MRPAASIAGMEASSVSHPVAPAPVPRDLTLVPGVSSDELGSRTRGVMGPTLAFAVGFAAVLAMLGAGAGLIGHSPAQRRDTLNVVAGVLLIAFVPARIAAPRMGLPQADRRLAPVRRPTTLGGAGLAGAAFAVGRPPGIGPTPGSILAHAARTGPPCVGATPSFSSALGLGVPFPSSGLSRRARGGRGGGRGR